jgi:[protein-PII] uridylyltransferase
MEVTASDRPGFLFHVGTAMSRCGARLQGAKIATYGSRVEDIFFITDKEDKPITDPAKFEKLSSLIIESLS